MIPRYFPPALALLAFSSALAAQNVYLTEDFQGGVFPPAGWTEGLNGVSVGWELEAAGFGVLTGSDHAWHDDYTSFNDNYLMSPAMDLTGATVVYAHVDQGVSFASWRDHHYVDISLDGGLSFINVADDTAPNGAWPLAVNLGAYAGTNGVNLSFHYTGDYASEWEIDNVLVNDQAPPPTSWTVNLPTAFVAANGYTDGFETYGGVVPPHMATTAIDPATGLPDAEAWCDIAGSSGLGAATGTACLEMGLDPVSNNYHYVRNALVIGLNGAGAAGLTLDFAGIDFGEEQDDIDGIWVSIDGATWWQSLGGWASLGSAGWAPETGIDLSGTPVVTSGNFYLMFAQEDNFPYGFLDGIGIDDISISSVGPSGPLLSVSNLVAGGVCTIQVQNATPNGLVRHGYSLAGGGPISTPYGDLLLSPPYTELPSLPTDANGFGSLAAPIPPSASGVQIWLHAFDILALTFSNGVAEIIL